MVIFSEYNVLTYNIAYAVKFCFPLLLVLLQPLQATLVGQVLDFEVLKGCLEAVAVGAGSHHSYHHRGVVLQPAVAHHSVVLIVKRVENLHRIESAYRLDTDVLHRLVHISRFVEWLSASQSRHCSREVVSSFSVISILLSSPPNQWE